MVANFSKKRKGEFWGNKLALQALGILLLIIMLALAFADFKMYKKKRELISKINNYKEQIEDIKKNNQELRAGIANADNIDYLEKIAYEQLGQQKPGEKAVIFIAPEQKTSESPKPENVWAGWFSGFLDWIKSRF